MRKVLRQFLSYFRLQIFANNVKNKSIDILDTRATPSTKTLSVVMKSYEEQNIECFPFSSLCPNKALANTFFSIPKIHQTCYIFENRFSIKPL